MSNNSQKVIEELQYIKPLLVIEEVETGVKDRLEGTFKVLIEQADINPILSTTVETFFTKFMKTTDEAALIEILTQLQETFIPYILNGDE